MATPKARLEFVRAYYEFGPKALYSDMRAATDGKPAEAAAAAGDKPAAA